MPLIMLHAVGVVFWRAIDDNMPTVSPVLGIGDFPLCRRRNPFQPEQLVQAAAERNYRLSKITIGTGQNEKNFGHLESS